MNVKALIATLLTLGFVSTVFWLPEIFLGFILVVLLFGFGGAIYVTFDAWLGR